MHKDYRARCQQLKTRGHSAKIVKNRCCLDIRHHFFSERVINRWNRLDQHVIDSATLNAFKSGLERTRNEKIGFFTDWWSTKPMASPIHLDLGAAAPVPGIMWPVLIVGADQNTV